MGSHHRKILNEIKNMITNIICQHCGQTFEAEIVDKTEFCPHCGKETAVVPAQVDRPVDVGAGNLEDIRERANTLTVVAIVLMCLGVLLVLAGIMLMAGERPGDSRQSAAVLCLGLGGGMTGASAWLFLLAQIVHIRANTLK
jgi:hypothetical protein